MRLFASFGTKIHFEKLAMNTFETMLEYHTVQETPWDERKSLLVLSCWTFIGTRCYMDLLQTLGPHILYQSWTQCKNAYY